MGKTSKKKQWRKNLDDSEVVEHIKKQSHQERHGPAVESLKDDQLFFVDKSADHEAMRVGTRRPQSGKREMRPTRAQLILSAPQKVKPVIEQKRAPSKKRKEPAQVQQLKQQPPAKKNKQQQQQGEPSRALVPDQSKSEGEQLDLWGEDGNHDREDLAPSTSEPSKGQQQQQQVQYSARGPSVKRKGSRSRPTPPIKAVEIDMAGCSYNPEEESHQDALAAVVAAENRKLLKKELAPPPVPLVDAAQMLEQDELAQLQTYADEDDNEIQLGSAGGEDGAAVVKAKLALKAAQMTTKDRNRQARRMAQEQELELKRALKQQRVQLEHLASLQKQLEEEEEEGKRRLLRRQVVKAEKAASQPPRLGKHRFEDMSVQVQTSDEVGSGLRRLRGCPMLALERFKSIQKRGLVEPRKRNGPKGPKRLVEYEKQARRERALEGQAELLELQKANKQKKGKK
uniref:Ribosome biogenesis protein NOP53 n=1 Tax=Dunaliella tertiolecta TaxID=3047 RepID=A0A7S3QKN9_DUNTE|mmetsp:Transcript_22783/g.62972  ORF Transcript_22783/g.62972 Transcript_22783/m.62972 type:complete len:455 (+) Transcript_22783:125-1489(+)|eukprot:CAMPEP_0202346240 /NCGR_PEP_ID=MMETSP1126-20121109/5117_1 /ASSEMBLY_ACC=CAM_ASM_000457 /TAXON_ID=3047 /ORGANISM="Dunaliella tertiolecta, Strain CCMP1320" /LENGTH=454 /DNA_ID=CAMNT_0048937623 /DNA_START=102 /DNA_END=1466 /DNA_ORIENTATION=-